MAMKFESYSEDFSLFAQKSEEQMKILQAIGAVVAGEVKAENISSIKELKCVKEFLESPMNDAKELSLKKVFAAAMVIANEKGILPFALPESVEEIAGMIDDGLTRIKVAFKEQVGELDVHEAADILVDRMAARAIAVVERAIDVGLPIAAKKLASVMAQNPYTAPLAPIVETVVPYVAEPIKKIVVTGIKVFAEKSKPIIHKAIDKVKGVVNKVGKVLTSKICKLLLS